MSSLISKIASPLLPRPLYNIVSNLYYNAKAQRLPSAVVIESIGRLAIASVVISTYLKNVSPFMAAKTALQHVQSNPLTTAAPIAAYAYLLQNVVPSDITYMTVGGWICWQSITSLMTAVTQKNKLSMAYAAGGYLLGKLIMDLSTLNKKMNEIIKDPSSTDKLGVHPDPVIKAVSWQIHDILSIPSSIKKRLFSEIE